MRRVRKAAGLLCLATAIILAIFWAAEYLPILEEYREGRRLYDEIEDEAVSDPEDETDSAFDDWKENLDIEDEEKEKVTLPIDVDGLALFRRNSDYIGWIYIPDTVISYPVVASEDNEDYLHRSFDKEYLYAGTIFMDCRCYDGITNKHSILYGHNMRDGSMFARIKDYADKDFLEDHPYFWFITPEYKLLYQVFSVTRSSPYDETVYSVTYDGLEDFSSQMRELAEMSLVDTGIVPTDADFVMTLSTCTSTSADRLAVHGVLLGALQENR